MVSLGRGSYDAIKMMMMIFARFETLPSVCLLHNAHDRCKLTVAAWCNAALFYDAVFPAIDDWEHEEMPKSTIDRTTLLLVSVEMRSTCITFAQMLKQATVVALLSVSVGTALH